MRAELLLKLRQLSAHEKVSAITVRIPVSLEKRVRELCEEERIPIALVIRELVQLGWEEFNREDTEGKDATPAA